MGVAGFACGTASLTTASSDVATDEAGGRVSVRPHVCALCAPQHARQSMRRPPYDGTGPTRVAAAAIAGEARRGAAWHGADETHMGAAVGASENVGMDAGTCVAFAGVIGIAIATES
eukprot:610079-Prymnesium_polylepis.1